MAIQLAQTAQEIVHRSATCLDLRAGLGVPACSLQTGAGRAQAVVRDAAAGYPVDQSGHVRGRDRRRADLVFVVAALLRARAARRRLAICIALDFWLFVTVLFANFATALAEARGKAQAESLRRTRRDTPAYRLR